MIVMAMAMVIRIRSTSPVRHRRGMWGNSDDCDDKDKTIHPGASETCNNEDDDCDGSVDEGLNTTYYRDADGDGYGDVNDTVEDCSPPSGYVENHDDCDDDNAKIYPGRAETCNGLDDDCDGTVDEGIVMPTFYGDADGDGYGVSTDTVQACAAPEGYVSNDADCDDSDAGVNPGAAEILDNGIDDDCDPETTDISLDVDSDEDGMPDYWETTFGLSPHDGGDADDDPDGDGFTNLEEFLGVTSPKNGNEFPKRPEVKEAHPHPGQGIDAGTLDVPNDTAIVVWLKDDTGIDVSDGACSITVQAGGQTISGVLTKEVVEENDESQYWLIFQPEAEFAAGVSVEVTVNATDDKGLSMAPYTYQFRVETNENTNTPVVSTSVQENTNGTETVTITAESDIKGAVISYTYDPDDSPVIPRFGAVDEIPDLEEVNGIGLPVNLEPPMIFPEPVTVRIPCPGTDDVSNLDIYYYNSQNGWVLAYDHEYGIQEGGKGWMVQQNGKYRVDRNSSDPKTIEIYLKHFSAAQAAGIVVSNDSDDGGGDDGGGAGSSSSSSNWSECFISTIYGN